MPPLQMDEKYAFFAPIWRVMRDNNMTVAEVKDQVQYVALSVKQASQVSDLRHHHYSAEKLKVRDLVACAMWNGFGMPQPVQLATGSHFSVCLCGRCGSFPSENTWPLQWLLLANA